MKSKILIAALCLMLIPAVAYAVKAFIPDGHQTIQTVGCADTSNTNEIEYLNCDASGNLIVSIVPSSSSNVDNGVVDIPNAGATDRTQMTAFTVVGNCTLQAFPGNTGPIFYGGSTVTNSSGTNEGIRLNQNDSSPPLIPSDLDELYVATDNAGDDIKWFCN